MTPRVLASGKLKATIAAKALAAALQNAAAIVSARNTIPILSNMLVETRRALDGEGQLVVTSTDLDLSVTLTLPAEVEEDAAITAPAHILSDALKKAPKDAIATLAVEGTDLVVKYGRARFKLQTLPASDFPTLGTPLAPIPQVESGKTSFALAADAFIGLLDAVEMAISSEETRYYLCGVYLHRKGDKLRAVATNGHVLSLRDVDAPDGTEGMLGVILPRTLVKTARSLWGQSKEELAISVDKSRISIAGGGIALTSKLIDGTFPDYLRVVPGEGASGFKVPPSALADAIERVMIMADGKARSVKLAMEGGALSLSARGEGANAAAEALDGAEPDAIAEGYAIGFNARYALDALRSLPGDAVEVRMSSPGDPMLWRNPAEAGALWVVMPLRV
ncbi:DNA polymerase III subunit beta [Xanthobacter aminoxidans]|uniref:DNA polymerase III subunit beta n=1 Tax=Xanthobacter aminoxidans TaxID=186280 RepID=UPI003726E5A7